MLFIHNYTHAKKQQKTCKNMRCALNALDHINNYLKLPKDWIFAFFEQYLGAV